MDTTFILKFIIGLLLWFILDYFWMYRYTKPSYNKITEKIKHNGILKTSIPFVYPFISLLLSTFFLPSATLTNAFFIGGFLGFLNYFVFNTTNYMIFRNWDCCVPMKDTCIGTLFAGLLAFLTILINNRILMV